MYLKSHSLRTPADQIAQLLHLSMQGMEKLQSLFFSSFADQDPFLPHVVQPIHGETIEIGIFGAHEIENTPILSCSNVSIQKTMKTLPEMLKMLAFSKEIR